VLNGSKVVTNWLQSGNYWYATGQTQQTIESADPRFRCEGAYAGCTYDDDLYIDNRSLWQVMSKAELVPGTFYFDYAADTIWIADNPTGHLLEATVAQRALIGSGRYSPVSSVQFKGFLVEKFSTPAQVAAVTISSGGLVEGNEIRFVHGIGVTAYGSRGRVLRNYIHHNGQMGIASEGGAYVLWQGNEIARNNTAGYHSGWEGGGGKLWGAIGNVFDRNYSHDNGFNRVNGGGPGIWEDGGSIGNIFSNNYISNNATDGIELEISYDTQVFGNTIVGNGTCGGCWGAAVLIENTRNVETYGNYIDSNRKGVLFINTDRGSGKYGVYEVRGGYVHDNVIRMPLVPSDTNPYSGFKYSNDSSLFSSSNVRFANNTYYLIAPSAKQFAWNGEQYAKEAWMSFGQDVLSTYYSL
jgi:parallel beta-helix repeat protein